MNKLYEWCAFYGEPAALAVVIEAFGPEALPSAPDWTALEGAIKFAAWCPPSRERMLMLRRWLRSSHKPLLPFEGFPWQPVLDAFDRDVLYGILTTELIMIRHCDCDVCKGLQAEDRETSGSTVNIFVNGAPDFRRN